MRFYPWLRSKVLLTLFSAACFIAGTGLHAQDTLGFTPNGFLGMPDTVYAGYSTQVGVIIKNYSGALYADSLAIDGYIDTGSTVIPFSSAYAGNDSITPGDSLAVFFPVLFDNSAGFRIGNNVIVIWPRVYQSGFNIRDSLRATVFVIDTLSGIARTPDGILRLSCFPVPATGPLYVRMSSPMLNAKEIFVRDAAGRLIYSSQKISGPIDTSPWPAGFYTLDILFANGERGTCKILHRR